MKNQLLVLAAALSCAFAASALATTKVEYKAETTRISADYKVAKEKCSALKSNAKDVCVLEAKGVEKVAKAEAEAAYEPSAKHTQAVANVKADTAYKVAKEKCDDLSGNAKDVCVKDAKVIHVKGLEDAKIARVAADTSSTKSDKMMAVKKDANAEEREAGFKAAKERCDALAGAVKDTCVMDAKAKFSMK